MEIKKPISKAPLDYEILIRKRGENDFTSYCPQLNFLFKANTLEDVKFLMKDYIEKFIESIENDKVNNIN
jgi:hypothetical protein